MELATFQKFFFHHVSIIAFKICLKKRETKLFRDFVKKVNNITIFYAMIEVLKQYEKLKLETNEDKYVEIIDALTENIKYYTIASPQQSFLLLSYVLTPQGRSKIYERENKRRPENEIEYITFDDIKLPDLLSN